MGKTVRLLYALGAIATENLVCPTCGKETDECDCEWWKQNDAPRPQGRGIAQKDGKVE